MSLGRVIGIIVVVLILFAIISAPRDTAATTRNGLSGLQTAGSSITTFFTNVVHDLAVNTGSTSGSRTSNSGATSGSRTSYPAGGVETGDGSTPVAP